MTDEPTQVSKSGARSELIRYLHYVLSTGQYRTFAYWKRTGEPNPFLKEDLQRDATTRSEIHHLITNRRDSQQ